MEIILDEAAAKARYQPRMIETVPIGRGGPAPTRCRACLEI